MTTDQLQVLQLENWLTAIGLSGIPFASGNCHYRRYLHGERKW